MHTLDPNKLFSCFIILLFVVSNFLGALAEAFANQVYDLANLRTCLNRGGNEEEWRGVE